MSRKLYLQSVNLSFPVTYKLGAHLSSSRRNISLDMAISSMTIGGKRQSYFPTLSTLVLLATLQVFQNVF